MKKGCVYIFRQKGTDFVKIGMSSCEDATDRFNNFKTYSPTGAEIISIIPVENPRSVEKQIHSMFYEKRMSGEFFKLSQKEIDIIIGTYSDSDELEIINEIKSWISKKENDRSGLLSWLRQNDSANKDDVMMKLIVKRFGGQFCTTGQVLESIKVFYNINSSELGAYMRKKFKRCTKRVDNVPVKGYLINNICSDVVAE